MSGFERVQILLRDGIVDTQELIGGDHHVDTVKLALSAFSVHELVAYHQKGRPAQSR